MLDKMLVDQFMPLCLRPRPWDRHPGDIGTWRTGLERGVQVELKRVVASEAARIAGLSEDARAAGLGELPDARIGEAADRPGRSQRNGRTSVFPRIKHHHALDVGQAAVLPLLPLVVPDPSRS